MTLTFNLTPVKDGYKFIGWYMENGEKFDFNTVVTSDITLKAKWEKESSSSNLTNTLLSKEYNLEYFDGDDPGITYEIKIDKNADIQVTKKPGCSLAECAEGTYTPPKTTYTLKFHTSTKNNIKNKYIPKIFGSSTSKKLYGQNLDADIMDFIHAAIIKDESYIK